jgi:S1-C subfamily serine protease
MSELNVNPFPQPERIPVVSTPVIPTPVQPIPQPPISTPPVQPIPQPPISTPAIPLPAVPTQQSSLPQIDQFYFDAVVQIHTYSPEINPLIPFQTAGTREGRGTGFFVDKNIIMTAAHVVSKTYLNTGVKFTIPSLGNDKLFSARVITFIPEIDMAILVVTSPNFEPRTKWFKFGNDKNLVPGSVLTVVGFPLGANGLKVHKSTFNGLQDGVIQIDSSINPGNSGGPVLTNQTEVVGIVSSGFDPRFANSVAFAIPIGVFLSTLPLNPFNISPNEETRVLDLPSLGMLYHNGTRTQTQPQIQSTDQCQEGVTVQWVSRHSSLYGTIHVGDKLCAIIDSKNTEYKINNVGDVNVSWYSSKVPLPYAIALLPVNDPIQVRYWNDQTKQVSVATTTLAPVFRGAFKPVYYPFETIDYETFGGLVICPLRSIHLAVYKHLFFKLTPDEKERDHLIITYVFPNSLMAQAGILSGGELLKSVNGQDVHTMSEFRNALKSTPLNGNIQWITTEHEKIELPLDELLKEQPILKQEYKFNESNVYRFLVEKRS